MKIKTILASLAAVSAGVIIAADEDNMAAAAGGAIDACLYVIIPSLFGFMALSAFLIRTGLYAVIFKPLYFIFKRIIRLDERQFSVLLLSLVGGYPVGARLISDVCAEDENDPIKEILPFCYCGSPVFLISIVGTSIYGDAGAGFAVYISNMLSCLILAAIYTRFAPRFAPRVALPKTVLKSKNKKINFKITQKEFIGSVNSAAFSLFPVCAMVVAFGLITRIAEFLKVNQIFSFLASAANADKAISDAFFFGFLEISRVSSLKGDTALLPFIAALCSFGGVCVVLQAAALAGKAMKLGKFLLWRIPAAALSGLICFLLTKDRFPYVETAAQTAIPVITETGNPFSSLILLVMSLFVIALAYRREKINLSISDK